MADPSLLPCLAPPLPQHTALPQAMMKPSDSAAISGIGPKIGRQTTTTTTRVLLRVKRRRPSPTSADATSATSTQPSATGTAATADNAVGASASAPDRIQLALPCILEGSSKKRRKLAEQREELALIRRLDSGMSIHNNNNHNNEATKRDGSAADASNAAVFHTPTRRGSSLGGNNNPYDPNINKFDMTSALSGMDKEEVFPLASGQCTPPSNISKLLNKNNSPHTTHTATTTTTTTTSETPAPPTKPKRTVIFRKISNLQKRILDPESVPNAKGNDSQEPSNHHPSGQNIHTNNAPATGDSQMTSGAGEGGGWSPLCESKSKWLRIVDVMLNEDEDVDQISSICSSSNATSNDGNNGNNTITGDGNTTATIVGSGQRVRRMRPRPSLENDNHEEEGKGRNKRRKLGWVVEQSRTMLESDFWNDQIGGGDTASAAPLATAAANSSNNTDDLLDPEVVRLIEYSLCALHQQNGGSVSPHLSFLKADPRLGGFTNHTPRSTRMVNHALLASTAYSSNLLGKELQQEAGGRTVLHIAALWGDLAGTLEALEMGADPTIHDARGNTPTGLARKGNHHEIVKVLLEGERRAVQEKDVRCDGNGGEYYYDVYCLEETTTTTIDDGKEASGTKLKKEGSNNPIQAKSSQFLQPKNANTASSTAFNSDTIPDLERSSVLSEDDDTTISSNKNHRNSHCALIELQKGFGYWNERGELILEPAPGDDKQRVGVVSGSGDGKLSSADNNDEDDDARFVQRFYNNNIGEDDSMGDNDEGEHDSNNEGYDGNDYPDEYSFGMDSDDDDDYRDADHAYGDARSDDDSEDDWKLDFRKRFVARSALDQYDFGSNDGEEMG